MHDWGNFYSLAGTAGASLIGLLFVMVSLGSDMPSERAITGIRVFLTPTLLHFCSALFQALVMLAPWPSMGPAGGCLGACGVAGLVHQISVIRSRKKLAVVLHGWDDWIPYSAVPLLANVCLIAGAVGMIGEKSFALYGVAGATTLFLMAGVYGAWDLTVWMISKRRKDG